MHQIIKNSRLLAKQMIWSEIEHRCFIADMLTCEFTDSIRRILGSPDFFEQNMDLAGVVNHSL